MDLWKINLETGGSQRVNFLQGHTHLARNDVAAFMNIIGFEERTKRKGK